MALSCVISEIKRYIDRKLWFFHTTLHSTPPSGGPAGILPCRLLSKNYNGVATWRFRIGLRITVSTEYRRVTDRQTDRRWETNALCSASKCRQWGWIGSRTSLKTVGRQIWHPPRAVNGPATSLQHLVNQCFYTVQKCMVSKLSKNGVVVH